MLYFAGPGCVSRGLRPVCSRLYPGCVLPGMLVVIAHHSTVQYAGIAGWPRGGNIRGPYVLAFESLTTLAHRRGWGAPRVQGALHGTSTL